jgi:hypothetical protein
MELLARQRQQQQQQQQQQQASMIHAHDTLRVTHQWTDPNLGVPTHCRHAHWRHLSTRFIRDVQAEQQQQLAAAPAQPALGGHTVIASTGFAIPADFRHESRLASPLTSHSRPCSKHMHMPSAACLCRAS